MPTVVQLEVVHYLAKRLGLRGADAIDAFLAQAGKVEALTGGIVVEAAQVLMTHREHGIGSRDAAILVTAKRNDARLVTHDAALSKVAKAMGIRTHSPLKH